jgi:hypothetical protein
MQPLYPSLSFLTICKVNMNYKVFIAFLVIHSSACSGTFINYLKFGSISELSLKSSKILTKGTLKKLEK